MTHDDIEDHPLLVQKIAAKMWLDRGFIVLRTTVPDVSPQFTAVYNFDVDRYYAACTADPNATVYSKDEYVHLAPVITPLLSSSKPLISHNSSSFPRNGGVIPYWPLYSVMIIPLPSEAHAEALLWCDRKIMRGLWTDVDLVQVTALIHEFYNPAEPQAEHEPERKYWRKITCLHRGRCDML